MRRFARGVSFEHVGSYISTEREHGIQVHLQHLDVDVSREDPQEAVDSLHPSLRPEIREQDAVFECHHN